MLVGQAQVWRHVGSMRHGTQLARESWTCRPIMKESWYKPRRVEAPPIAKMWGVDEIGCSMIDEAGAAQTAALGCNNCVTGSTELRLNRSREILVEPLASAPVESSIRHGSGP